MTTSSAERGPRAREQVRRAIRTTAARLPKLFSPGTKLIVGYSGGQDSTCLLHALATSHRQLDLLAVHVDHGLRKTSGEEAQQVAANASAMGVTCLVARVDVAGHRKATKTTLQEAARTLRYAALARAVDQHGAAALVVAHTADDQAETLLLHLLRGAGLQGLSAMRLETTLKGVRVVRPLLRIARATTLAYCGFFGLPVVEDASNQHRVYTRNRVRLDLLPVLEQFNPAIRKALARTADLAAEDDAALEAIVKYMQVQLSSAQSDHDFDLRVWRAQPRAFQRRLLRSSLAALSSSLADVPDAPVEDALDLLQTGQPNSTYHLPNGIELCIGQERFVLLERAKIGDMDVSRV